MVHLQCIQKEVPLLQRKNRNLQSWRPRGSTLNDLNWSTNLKTSTPALAKATRGTATSHGELMGHTPRRATKIEQTAKELISKKTKHAEDQVQKMDVGPPGQNDPVPKDDRRSH